MKRSAAFLILLALAIPASADNFDLGWWTVDGGGGMFSTGGSFSLGGTIGQPDAGAVLSGGEFSLVGGFWAAAESGAPPCGGDVRGDSDCDGSVNFADIDCFVAALIDQPSWQNCGNAGGCDYICVNDVNQDQAVNFNDIDTFVECLVNNGCP